MCTKTISGTVKGPQDDDKLIIYVHLLRAISVERSVRIELRSRLTSRTCARGRKKKKQKIVQLHVCNFPFHPPQIKPATDG